MLEYNVKNRRIDNNLINVLKKKNIDCNMIHVIKNIDNMKKIGKENQEIIDQLEIDLE